MDLDRIFTRLNGAIQWILRSPLHALLDPGLMLVTVTGRRSGLRFTIPVGYQRDGKRIVVLVSKARRKNWWRNYHEPRAIEVTTGGRELRGTARVIAPGSQEFFAAFETTLAKMPWLGRQFGIAYRRGTALDAGQRAALAREDAAVEILLE